MTDLSDEELVPLVVDGDDAACAELFGRHAPRLRRRVMATLSLQVRSRYSVSDILQEGLSGAWRSLARFEDRGKGSFGRWLTGIVDNKTKDVLRRHKRDVERDKAARPVPNSVCEVARRPSPSAESVEAELKARLGHCIDELPASQREAARLVIGKGMSFAAAARHLGVDPDVLRQRVVRGRERVWRCIKRWLD